jgi:hypothetical protein
MLKAEKQTKSKKVIDLRKQKSQTSVENGIAILTTAIENELSLSEASRQHSFGRNYISDVKSRIEENLEKKLIKRETYRNFKKLLKAYNKL